jgi:hypothetical protein
VSEEKSLKDIIDNTKEAKNISADPNANIVFKTRSSKYSNNSGIPFDTRVELSTRTVLEDKIDIPSNLNQNESKNS